MIPSINMATYSKTVYYPGGMSAPFWWLDANDSDSLWDDTTGGSLVAADGSVARWEDKSGNGHNATQTTSGSRPTRKTSIKNGKDILRFDGSADHLLATGATLNTDNITIFVVCYATSATNYQSVVRFQQASSPYFVCSWGSSRLAISHPDGATTGISNGAVNSEWNILTIQRERNLSDGLRTWRNGTAVTTRSTANSALANIYACIGRYQGGSEYFNGDIGEIVMYKSVLGSTDRGSVESYLSDKWDI